MKGAYRWLQGLYQEHSAFFLLLILFASFRLLTLLFFRPGGYLRDWSDLDTYLGIAATSDSGLYPYLHYWLEWPPIIPWLFVALYRLSLLIPPWEDTRFWFGALLGSVLLLFEAGNFALIYLLARSRGEARFTPAGVAVGPPGLAPASQGNRLYDRWFLTPPILYMGLFVPVYALAGFFDAVPLFFMLLGLWLLLRGRAGIAGASFGLGFMTKLTPLILLPVGLRALPRWQTRGAHLLGATLAILIMAAPFLWLRPDFLLASLRGVLGRSSWETVWALLEGYYGFGAVGGDRLNPAETAFAIHPGYLPWWLITLAFLGVAAWLYARHVDYADPRKVISLAGLTVSLFLLYSKGYSPQFLVYLLPFVLLLLPPGQAVVYSLLLTALNFLEQPIYFVLAPDQHWLLIGIVLARTLLLVALTVEFVLLLFDREPVWVATTRRWGLTLFTLALLLGVLLAVPRLGAAYAARRYSEEPYRPAIGFLGSQPGGALLFSEGDLYRRFFPYLRKDYTFHLAQAKLGALTTVVDRAALDGRVWLVEGPQANPAVADALAARLPQVGTYRFPTLGVLRLYQGQPLLPLATLGGKVALLSATAEPASPQPGGEVHLILYWQALSPLERSYTVFTHLTASDGRVVAGQDNLPARGASPTDRWQIGQVVQDPHDISLPADLARGGYRLSVGMYDAANSQRLPAAGPDGQGVPGDEIAVGAFSLGW